MIPSSVIVLKRDDDEEDGDDSRLRHGASRCVWRSKCSRDVEK